MRRSHWYGVSPKVNKSTISKEFNRITDRRLGKSSAQNLAFERDGTNDSGIVSQTGCGTLGGLAALELGAETEFYTAALRPPRGGKNFTPSELFFLCKVLPSRFNL